MNKNEVIARYIDACNYPGIIDPAGATEALKKYCASLGVRREIRRIEYPWWKDVRLIQWVIEIVREMEPKSARAARAARDARDARDALDALDTRDARAARDARDARAARAARDARDARAALDARDARAARAALDARDARAALDALNTRDANKTEAFALAIKRFGEWCLFRSFWWMDDISFYATTYIGALQNGSTTVQNWSEHVYGSFCAGVWFTVWTSDVLYWVEKPTISVETGAFGRRLHNESGPACANVIENLYFIHGVMVPAHAVVAPESITFEEIEREDNNEVRRILTEIFGWERYIRESGAKQVDRRFNERDGQWEQLFQLKDGSRRVVLVDPSTSRKYALGCPRAITNCEQAQAWMSHGLDSLAIHRS